MQNSKLPKTQWNYRVPSTELVERIEKSLNLPAFISRVLVQRGFTDPQRAYEFLNPSLLRLYDPFLLDGMDVAVARIRHALMQREKIMICGDYDVDGITSVALLKKCLSTLGDDVYEYLPNRLEEGYGFHQESVNIAAELGVKLIITVDCGVTAREAVVYSRERGIDVIITDHHEPNGPLPEALAILNPKIENSRYPDNNLAGIGVAFKLAQALIHDKILEYPISPLLELVALGTVADVAQLTGENRILVHYGLEALTHTNQPGLRALMRVAGVARWRKLDPVAIGYQLGPRINAVGRLGTPRHALNLLMTKSADEANQLAQELNRINQQRQAIEEEILINVEKQVTQMDLEKNPFIVVAGEDWHEGVIGIVASRMTEKTYRPTCVISIKGDEGKGSGRSIPEFSLFDCLCDLSDMLLEFGGHQIAAGFRIATDKIDHFRERCTQLARERLEFDNLMPQTTIDAELEYDLLNFETIRAMSRLAPFGLGNPKPKFLIKGLRTRYSPRRVGNDGAHLKLVLTDGRHSMDAIGFGFGLYHDIVNRSRSLDLVATPEINFWNNREMMQLHIHDISPR